MPTQQRYDAFLSLNSKDLAAVEVIAKWLVDKAQLNVWFYPWELPPGADAQKALEEALNHSNACVVFIGPGGIGPWQNEEMRVALARRVRDESFHVVPIILPNGHRPLQESDLPPFLRNLIWEPLRDLQDENALHRLRCGILGLVPGRQPEMAAREIVCPFRGLEYFREEDEPYFFGRKALVDLLFERLTTDRFLAVLGPSGSGKSSVVRAGLIPKLKREHKQHHTAQRAKSLVTIFTPKEEPMRELAFAVRHLYQQIGQNRTVEEFIERLRKNEESLYLIIREIAETATPDGVFLVIDQFEELFAQSHDEHLRQQFLDRLFLALEGTSSPIRIIVAMRSDFLGKCASYAHLNAYLNDKAFQIGLMSREEMREAIVEPAASVELVYEEGLVDRILKDVAGASAELPLLEHALLELYERRRGRLLTFQTYTEIGGVEGALTKHAEMEFSQLGDSKQQLIRKMFILCLIQTGEDIPDIPRRCAKEELLAIGGKWEIAEALLEQWTAARLLTITHDLLRGKDFVEVAHYALIHNWPRLQNWLDENREAIRLYGNLRQAAKDWEDFNRAPEYLYSGVRLLKLEELNKTYAGDMQDLEKEFIRASLEHREAEAQKKEAQRRKELEMVTRLATESAKSAKRLRAIVAVALFALVLVSYLARSLDIAGKKTKDQLARNYWEIGRAARTEGLWLNSIHLMAEAIGMARDKNLFLNIAQDLSAYLPQTRLSSIISHDAVVSGAVFSKAGARLLTWCYDSTARVWETASGSRFGAVLKHHAEINDVVFNHAGTQALIWSYDGAAQLWDIASGAPIGAALKHRSMIRGATFDKDESRILTWSDDGAIRLWETTSGVQIGATLKHQRAVNGAIFNKNETRILAWSDDGIARLWDVASGAQIGPALTHQSVVNGAVFNNNETRILTWSDDSTAQMWHAATGVRMGPTLQHKSSVLGAVFNTDETRILSWSRDKTVRLWNVADGSSIGPALEHDDEILDAGFNKDETRILAKTLNSFWVWNAAVGAPIGPALKYKTDFIGAVSRDKTRILTWSVGSKTPRLWQVANDGLNDLTLQHKDAVNGAVFNQNETRILTCSSDSTAQLWDVASGVQLGPPFKHNDKVRSAIFNKDATYILTWSEDGVAQLWDAASGAPIGPPLKHEKRINGALFNQGGTCILTWSDDSTARLWNVKGSSQIGPIFKHDDKVNGAGFNKEENRLLTYGTYAVQLWDVAAGTAIGQKLEHGDVIRGAVFNDKETCILIYGLETARVWDIASGNPIGPILKPQGWIRDAFFTRDENRILMYGAYSAQFWDVNQGIPISPSFQQEGKQKGLINGAVLNKAATCLLTWSADGTVQLYDAINSIPIGQTLKHKNDVNGAVFNKDETRILTWSGDNTACLWDLPGDLDFPQEKFTLQIMALTGTKFNLATKDIEFIEPERWRKLNEEYLRLAREHYKFCQYPRQNVYRWFFPQEAEEIKASE